VYTVSIVGVENWKIQTLPLARIKKIMKSEEFILQELEKDRQRKLAEEEGRAGVLDTEKSAIKFMISGEAPILMSKACELLIKDLSFRAWRHTERNRRRTLQRQDLHAAVGESEVYDFLIDIVPRVTTVTSQKVQVHHHPHPPSHMIPSAMGLGGVSHPGMGTPGIPHEVMHMHSGVHTGLPATISLPQGAVVATQDGNANSGGMMQHMETHQLPHPTQQQAYHYDPSQHAAAAQSQHVTQQTHHLLHDHQQTQQQQEGEAEETSTMLVQTPGPPGQLPPGSTALWHH
jgi:histone H3/H4